MEQRARDIERPRLFERCLFQSMRPLGVQRRFRLLLSAMAVAGLAAALRPDRCTE